MRRKLLAIGMAFISLTLFGNSEIYASENVDTTNVISAEANNETPEVMECWDGVSVEQPTETVVIDGEVYYKIYNAEQLAYIEHESGIWLTYNYVLANDIVMNGVEITWDADGNLTVDKALLNEWTPIDGLSGDFDGANYTIYRAYIDGNENVGIFNEVTGNISNLTVRDSYIKGSDNVAGIVVTANNINNCHYYGYVYAYSSAGGIAYCGLGNISNCTFNGEIRAGSCVGGIVAVGYPDGKIIENCINNGKIVADELTGGIGGSLNNVIIKDCVNNGAITCRMNFGGILGYTVANSQIINCTNNGQIMGRKFHIGGIAGVYSGVIEGCVNNGMVSATEEGYAVGGIIGYNQGRKVTNCKNYADIVGNSWGIGGIAGLCYHGLDLEISNCINYGDIITYRYGAGGILGSSHDNNKSLINGCINCGEISADEAIAGGIVGNGGTVNNSLNYGNVNTKENFTGGIAGFADNINYCINYANITSTGSYVGGIAGRIDSKKLISTHMYNLGNVSGNYYVGGVIGFVEGNVAKAYNVGNVDGASYVGGVAGTNELWSGSGTIVESYYLKSENINTTVNGLGNCESDVSGIAEAKPATFFPVCIKADADPAYEYLGYADMLFFVDRMYGNVLNREADAVGRLNWVEALKDGSVDGAAIAGEFILGEEFALRGLSDSEFLDVLYTTLLNREADASGKSTWLNVLASGKTRAYVLAQFVNLDEFTIVCEAYGISRGVMLDNGTTVNPGIPQFVTRLYEMVLGRSADAAGLYNNTVALYVKAETAETIAKNFFGSAEYTAKNKDNAAYISDLYNVFMNRAADSEGLSVWVAALEKGTSREVVLTEFASSEEFRILAASYGLE